MKTTYKPPKNDHISVALEKFVPEKYRGSDRFLDLITWNLRWFAASDKKRVARVVGILEALNADIFVLQEIEPGSLDVVAQTLNKHGAGHYKVAYGTTGGDQRVAMMYDDMWVRAKSDIEELFGKKQVLTSDGKDAFPRLPLYAYFTGLTHASDPFDFQLLGVHLKSQRESNTAPGDNGTSGKAQRELAARKLAEWLTKEAPKCDSDAVIIGDWNAPPTDPAWHPLNDLEKQKKAVFRGLNKANEISCLMYRSREDIGSRLDLQAMTVCAHKEAASDPDVVRWKSFDDLLNSSPQAGEIKKYINEIRNTISDHMPVLTRFYWQEKK